MVARELGEGELRSSQSDYLPVSLEAFQWLFFFFQLNFVISPVYLRTIFSDIYSYEF